MLGRVPEEKLGVRIPHSCRCPGNALGLLLLSKRPFSMGQVHFQRICLTNDLNFLKHTGCMDAFGNIDLKEIAMPVSTRVVSFVLLALSATTW